MHSAVTLLIAATVLAALAGCSGKSESMGLATPPKPKPEAVGVRIVDRSAAGTKLTRARVSTKSGDILILEPDGSVSEVSLDSPAGRDAFEVTEAELAELEVNLGLNLSPADIANFDIVAPEKRRLPTAQEKALKAFAARTRPALPQFPAGFTADPEDFISAKVDSVAGDRKGDLVEVTATLRAGVDAEVAFAYATCALAGWAKDQGKDYGRHIRTVQNKRRGKLLIGSVFTLSDSQPMGLRVMETDDTLRMCKDRGIPAA
jgi:hypothetical protein